MNQVSLATGSSEQAAQVTAGLIGLAVGDALGVPVEFSDRGQLDQNPVAEMRAYGTHSQSAGTWSDDTSLTLCLAESLCETGIDYHDQASRFVNWVSRGHWTPHGHVFDIGGTTSEAISRLQAGINPVDAGPAAENACGNGSLMRILPLGLYLAYAEPDERIATAMAASRLTHGHPRCQLTCALYVEIVAEMVRGLQLSAALAGAQARLEPLLDQHPRERSHLDRLFHNDISQLPRSQISGSGYVIDCLEASLWCALNARSYSDGVLAAVNLGGDTDTTGAVAGSLLGLMHGLAAIPDEWIAQLARRQDVLALAARLQRVCHDRWRQAR